VGIDLSRVATSALQAALEDGQQPEPKQHRRRLTAGKAIVGGAALAVAAKYAVDKTSPLKRKAAIAAVRHTVRNTVGDVIPESLHDKLMDVGFFDNDEEEFFDAPEGEGEQDEMSQDEEPGDEENFFDGPEDEEPDDEQGFFDAPEDEESEEPEDEEDVEEPEDEESEESEDEDVDEPEDEESEEPEDEDVDEP